LAHSAGFALQLMGRDAISQSPMQRCRPSAIATVLKPINAEQMMSTFRM
jgi:hypothetical protein